MRRVKSFFSALAVTVLMIAGVASPSFAQQQKFFSIGTGGVTGVYYPTGGAICRLFNKEYKSTGTTCSVESTGGSIYNINTIRAGELDFGIAQSDWQFHAFNGSDKFKEQGPLTELRAVFSIHPEPFTVLARADSGIKEFADLKGKRVNIGNPGSGQRGTMEVLMQALGWKMSDFKSVSELKSAEQAGALCDNKVDAVVFTVGHPSGAIKEPVVTCNAVLVNVKGPKIDELIKNNSYYREAIIPAGMYNNENDVVTFGVGATLVSSTKTSDDIVYKLVKSVFENFDSFKKLHPAFENLTEKAMVKDGLSAPLHEGAKKYYSEKGWL